MYKGSPFALSRFSVKKTIFLKYFKFSRADSNFKHSSGAALRMNTKSLVKAALGEHLERIAASKNYEKPNADDNHPTRHGFNLITGEKVVIPAEKVFLNFDVPLLRHLQNKDQIFNDSCGLASHVNSIEAIKNGFGEFIERQSLVYNWLSKSPGKKIKFDDICKLEKNDDLKNLIQLAECFSDEIDAYEVSIIDGFFVVLTVGHKGEAFSSGMGADLNILKALESSLYEYLMIMDSCLSIKANPKMKLVVHDNIYTTSFYSMNIKEFKEKFDYLIQSSNYLDINSAIHSVDDFYEIVRKTHEKFKIEIYCSFLPSPLKSVNVKVVKVFSPDAYPHIWTKIFDPSDYNITKQLPPTDFPNRFQSIPFA